MRRLIFTFALVAIVVLPATAAASTRSASATGEHGGRLSSIYLVGTLDRRDRPRVFARFDRTLPAARGDLRGARVRLVVHGDVAVRGTDISEPVHTVITRRLGSLRPGGSWRTELPLSAGQANRIERAAAGPGQLKIEGTAVQTVLTPTGGRLPSSQIEGVTESPGEEFEGQEIVNGWVGADYVVEEPGCEHSTFGCPFLGAEGHWSHYEWDGHAGGEDSEHGTLSMTVCNGEYTLLCEYNFGGIFASKETDSISAYPEGTAFFNVSEAADGISPEVEIAAGYNEHDHDSPPVSCRIPEWGYAPKLIPDGPEPRIYCSRTVEARGSAAEGEANGDGGEGVAYDSYMVSTVWPSGSNPPSPGP